MLLSWRPAEHLSTTPQQGADEPAQQASNVRTGATTGAESPQWVRQIRFRVPGPVTVAHRTVLRIQREALALL